MGDGTFLKPGEISTGQDATPLRTDLDGDGVSDVLIVDQFGEVLWRGRADVPGALDPPVVLNPGHPVRDIAVIANSDEKLIAAIDRGGGSVSLFWWGRPQGPFLGPVSSPPSTGSLVELGTLAKGTYFTRMVAGDSDGDGITDLAVLDAAGGTVTLFRGDGKGLIHQAATLDVGRGASDIAFLGPGLPDLVVTNRVAGLVSSFRNLGGFALTRHPLSGQRCLVQ